MYEWAGGCGGIVVNMWLLVCCCRSLLPRQAVLSQSDVV
jgi:hypothetical protein